MDIEDFSIKRLPHTDEFFAIETDSNQKQDWLPLLFMTNSFQ